MGKGRIHTPRFGEVRSRAGFLARVFFCVCVVTAVSLPLPSAAITRSTISIDGDLSDWTGVRSDPDNSSSDSQITDPDPDYPGQPDRDVYLVNATWDDEYLYLAYRRTAGGTKAITFGAYIDRGGDGLLHNNDVVAWWTVGQSTSSRYAWAQASSPSAGIFKYNQAVIGRDGPYLHPAGDPMGYDGETPDGWADVQSGSLSPVKTMDGWMASNGVEFEGRVAWSDLGLAPGSPIAIHFINSNGESFGAKWVPSNTRKWTGQPPQYVEENRGQVEDNVDDIWWLLLQGVTVSPDRYGGGEPGSTVTYTHTVTNNSNQADTLDLSAISSRGWAVRITDAGGSEIDEVSLARGASVDVHIEVTIPAGAAQGTRDTTVLTAASRNDPAASDSATDITTAGNIVVLADQSGSMAPGQIATYTFTVQNNSDSGRTFDLSALSILGYGPYITDVNGNAITSVYIGANASATVRVRVPVPTTATPGAQDVTRLTASVSGSPAIKSSATASTLVMAGLSISPDRAGFGGANSTVVYGHTVTNSWPETRTITLSGLSSRGFPVTVFDADGVTPLPSVTLGPNGASRDIVVRIRIPEGTAPSTDSTVITARTGTTTATATDTTTIRQLQLFSSPGYTVIDDAFELGEAGYARATGLSPASTVRFVWRDNQGNVYTGPDRIVDTTGMAFDDHPFAMTEATGAWTLELYSVGNGGKTTLLDSLPLTVTWNAEITQLTATDAPGVGSDIAVTSSVVNDNMRALANTTMTYVIWWDENGDGVFNSGDKWIDGAGAPHTWDGTSAVNSHQTTGINVPGGATWSEADPWTVNNRAFPHQGEYNITATWTEQNGRVIDRATTQFFSIPALGWPIFIVGIALVGALMSRRMLPVLAEGGERG